MDSRGDKSSHVIIFGKFENNKRYKESVVKEIIAVICAMLNTNGGKVDISIGTDGSTDIPVHGLSFHQQSQIIRILEQNMISTIGSNQTVNNINFEKEENRIVIFVEKSDQLTVTNYNLYLPSESQIVPILPQEPLKRVIDDIINRTFVPDPVQHGSHCKNFRKGKDCGFSESKTVEFKHVKYESAKRIRVADRITGKSNKFNYYVSGFANYMGGHIYYGIVDGGLVEGEVVSDKDVTEITSRIEKAIKKMIWRDLTDQPKRGVQWDVFFEPVLDANSNAIPSTYVIVIYIAPFLGGVFTEEPECYKMVDGKVKNKSLIESICLSVPGNITWSSKATQKLCIKVFGDLTFCLNNGSWEAFEKMSREVEDKYPDVVEVKLIVLLKQILACSRKHEFVAANGLLKEYNKLQKMSKDHFIFEVLGLYVHAAHTRPKGDKESNSFNHIRDLLVAAISKSEWLFPGLVTVLVFLFAGTMTDRFQDMCLYAPDVLSRNALVHLERIGFDHEVWADFKYKAHITLAMFYLDCNLSGKMFADRIDDMCLDKAASNLSLIDESVRQSTNKLTHYRDVQVNLAKSILLFRRSQNQISQRTRFLREAFELSKKSENLARKWKFYEMESWSRSVQALLTAPQVPVDKTI